MLLPPQKGVFNQQLFFLHIYPTGMHGWGFKDSFIYKREWTEELEKWLREINKQ